jgi:hypothetical protein
MQTVYIGNNLVNDVMLGSQRMDDVFTVKAAYRAEYLVVAGGGAGGNGQPSSPTDGGGGGAGGLLSSSLSILPNTLYQVYVGAGGIDRTINPAIDSYFTGSNAYIVANYGGAGGSFTQTGVNGGSGGGGGRGGNPAGGTGISGQGNNGAGGTTSYAGGGGGAGSAGSTSNGGSGKLSSITGTSVSYSNGGAGGTGGSDAAANTGNGGNGGRQGDTSGKIGGSGIVVIRYAGPQRGTGGTVTTDGGFTVHTFTANGASTYFSN